MHDYVTRTYSPPGRPRLGEIFSNLWRFRVVFTWVLFSSLNPRITRTIRTKSCVALIRLTCALIKKQQGPKKTIPLKGLYMR